MTSPADLELAADAFLAMCDRMIDGADYYSNDPETQVRAFIAGQLLSARRRTRDYIAALTMRLEHEQRHRFSIAQAVIDANCVQPMNDDSNQHDGSAA